MPLLLQSESVKEEERVRWRVSCIKKYQMIFLTELELAKCIEQGTQRASVVMFHEVVFFFTLFSNLLSKQKTHSPSLSMCVCLLSPCEFNDGYDFAVSPLALPQHALSFAQCTVLYGCTL